MDNGARGAADLEASAVGPRLDRFGLPASLDALDGHMMVGFPAGVRCPTRHWSWS
jgi:hypothetical protein